MSHRPFLVAGCILLLIAIVVSPVSAYMATAGSFDINRCDYTGKLYESKNEWKFSEIHQDYTNYPPDFICPNINIVKNSFDDVKCSWNLGYRDRLITPDGKNYDLLVRNNPSGQDAFKTKGGTIISTSPYLWTEDKARGEVVLNPYNLVKYTKDHNAEWRGTWTHEFWFETATDSCSPSDVDYTRVSVQTFTLVDDSTAKTTTSAATTPASPSYGVTTTPPAAQGHAVSISAMDYTDASVQKTGASWDSTAEKCPTWRGSDWSGTGDYYLSRGGDTLTYSLDIPVSGVYYLWMRDWSDTNHDKGDRQVTITVDGKTLGTFDAAASFNDGTTGYGWDKLTNIDLSAGSHTVKITKTATTSSAAIIDSLYFTPQSRDVPQGAIGHSESLCSGGTRSVTTQQTGMTYPVCTPPACKSGQTYVCLQQDNCPGGCGMSCSPAPTTTARSGIETALIIIAIIAGILLVGKQRG